VVGARPGLQLGHRLEEKGMMLPRRAVLSPWTLWRMAGRSFFLQVCWNFQKMQNLGFAYALTPVIRSLYPSRLTRAKAVRRHLEFFVSHPYCAAIILGVVARLEVQAVENGVLNSAEPNRIKVGMMGPLAALGDTLFWATLKPLLALLGSVWVFMAWARESAWDWLGPVLFLGIFTVLHLSVRLGGLWVGYRRGLEIIADLRRLNPQRLAQQLGLFAALAAGVAAAVFFQQRTGAGVGTGGGSLNTALLAALTALVALALRRGVSVNRLVYLLAAVAVLAAYLFKLG
jgi:mannose/fructose/N-acetylgalactosamine-specific phosphotransferase system component IID